MAEVERARSTRFRRLPPLSTRTPPSGPGSGAEALDGGRVPGVGERAATTRAPEATITLEPPPVGATVRLDGRATVAPRGVVTTRAGVHAIVLAWDDVPVWATWAEAPAGGSTVHLGVTGPAPCSSGDVRLGRAAGGAIDAERVRCGAWVAALEGPRPSSVLVATCAGERCGPLLEWDAPSAANWSWTPPPPHPPGGWPTWATWGLVGAGAVIATSVVLVASGALQAGPTETHFVSGGIKGQ